MDFKLPPVISIASALGARIQEIRALEEQLHQCKHGLRAFQKLPRNMQRRSVSSNPQRLPLYLREKHKRELGDNVKKSKRPCRKYRRRPQNLLAEYNRRQRDKMWLETHIWHAKRFHMETKWGYKLPLKPTAKAFRPSIRAATETCLLQDVSYECCFEIEGCLKEIQRGFSSLLSTFDASYLMDNEFRTGMKWHQFTLYNPNRSPFGAIGYAQVLWLSSLTKGISPRMWFWVHPSIYKEVLSILIDIFKLEKIENSSCNESEYLKASDPIMEAKLAPRNATIDQTPKYSSKMVKLVILKDSLVKFRLTGPKSAKIISNVFQPSSVLVDSSLPNYTDKKAKLPWWVEFYSNPLNVKAHEQFSSLWKSVLVSGSSSYQVLGLIARDPRAILPPKKKAFDEHEEVPSESQTIDNPIVSGHPIFDSAIRDSVTMTITPTHVLNSSRANLIVPGTRLPLTKEENRVPVLLLERPSTHVSGLGAGWDVVLPCGWGNSSLVSFFLNGAVIGGLAQRKTLEMEFLNCPDPHQLPDTDAGRLDQEARRQQNEEEYFKRPPNCRVNFLKLGIRSPFSIDWLELVQDWNSSCKDFYVLRDRAVLQWLSSKSCRKMEKATKAQGMESGKRPLEDGAVDYQKRIKLDGQEKSRHSLSVPPVCDPTQIIQGLKGALVYIRLVLLSKGSLEPFALICLPTEEDLATYASKKCCDLAEPPHQDPNIEERKELHIKHRKILARLRRKRKKARQELLCGEQDPLDTHPSMREAMAASVTEVQEKNKELVETVQTYNGRMQELWVKSQVPLQSSSRKIMGYLTQGDFCIRMGRPGGLGYVVSDALLPFMNRLNLIKHDQATDDIGDSSREQILVLVRNPSTLLYKWARLVVLNVLI